MNRKERKAAAKVNATSAQARTSATTLSVADAMAEARRHFQGQRYMQAQDYCHRILASQPSHTESLNLLGIIAQASGHHNRAIKYFKKAIASAEPNAPCHYNLACSYQAMNQRDEAAANFTKAIAFGLSDNDVEG